MVENPSLSLPLSAVEEAEAGPWRWGLLSQPHLLSVPSHGCHRILSFLDQPSPRALGDLSTSPCSRLWRSPLCSFPSSEWPLIRCDLSLCLPAAAVYPGRPHLLGPFRYQRFCPKCGRVDARDAGAQATVLGLLWERSRADLRVKRRAGEAGTFPGGASPAANRGRKTETHCARRDGSV